MAGCLAEDDLLDLARGRRDLADAPALEAHLADCPACSAVLATLSAAEPAASWGDLAGTTLGPYRLEARIGAGGMGEVYRARDERLSRAVAVKVLAPRLAAAPDAIRRLEAEARAAGRIAHPNVVTVFDVGADRGIHYVASELIQGESLTSVIARGPLPRERALALGAQLARGLAAAHEQGVVHRDLKPSNLLLTADGTLKILDFGLAKIAGARDDLDATEPGTVLGTVGYLSPEQARGEPADARSDLFAAGAVLFELLTGRRAFDGASFADRLSSVLRDTPAIDEPAVARCLEKDPRLRFHSASDLAWVLEKLQPPAAAPARMTRRAWLFAAGGLAVGGAAGALLGRRAPAPFTYQQLSFRQGRVASARFTPDGDSVVYSAAWEGEPLAVFATRVAGGGTRALPLPSADVLAVSSRGELALSLERRFVLGMHSAGTLAVVPLDGREPRALAEDVQEADFTPDGTELAVIRRAGPRFRLELPLGNVLHETAGWLAHARVSPDGREVACFECVAPFDDSGELVVIDRRSGRKRVAAGPFASAAGVAWAPGGALWYTAARLGQNMALHAAGRELPLAQTAGRLRLHDVAGSGRAAVSYDVRRLRTRIHGPGAAEETDVSRTDASMVTDISDDGASVLLGEWGEVPDAGGCMLADARTGAMRRIGPGLPLSLSRDGRLLALRFDGPPPTLVEYSLAAGSGRAIPLSPSLEVQRADWVDRDRFVLSASEAGRPPRLWLASLTGGAARPLTDEGTAGVPHVDPAGTRVAFIDEGVFHVVGLDGSRRALPGRFRDRWVCGWHTSGTACFVFGQEPPLHVDRVDLETGVATPQLALSPPPLGRKGFDGLAVSPAGDAYAYSYGEELSRLFVMS